MAFKDWFKSPPPKPPCNHSIGNNTSKEIYVWHGRNPTPYKHYTEFTCEFCGGYFRLIHSDAQLSYKDSEAGRYH
jgi:hypothetical protein